MKNVIILRCIKNLAVDLQDEHDALIFKENEIYHAFKEEDGYHILGTNLQFGMVFKMENDDVAEHFVPFDVETELYQKREIFEVTDMLEVLDEVLKNREFRR